MSLMTSQLHRFQCLFLQLAAEKKAIGNGAAVTSLGMFIRCSTFSSLDATYNSYSFYDLNFAVVEELALVAQIHCQRWKQLVELIKDPFFKCLKST